MTAPDIHCRSLIQAFREEHPAEHGLDLRFGGCRIRVTANRSDIAAALRDYFGPFVDASGEPTIEITVHEAPAPAFAVPFRIKPPDPGKTRIKEEFIDAPDGRIVRKRLTGMVFLFGGGSHLAIGPCMENLNQIVNFINNRFIEWALCRGSLLGHAAGIVWKGRGLALAGFSGAGKSTLALHIMSLGATFVSNDRLMIEPSAGGLIMRGVAKLPRINPGTILHNPDLKGIMSAEEQARFSNLPEPELWKLEHKYDADIESCFGPDRFVLESSMDALAILSWRRGKGEPDCRSVSLSDRTDLLPAFMKETGLFFSPENSCRMPEPNPENYVAFLSRCRVMECSGGIDFHAAAEALTAFLETL